MKQSVSFWLSEFKIDNEDHQSQVRLMNRTTKNQFKHILAEAVVLALALTFLAAWIRFAILITKSI